MDCRRLITLVILTLITLFTPNMAWGELAPSLGRFLQRDPNAAGQPLMMDAEWFHGQGPTVSMPSVDLGEHCRDGTNTYQYLISNPLTNSDPLGLFVMPGPSDFITGMLQSLVSEYAARQDFDVDWATDWEMGDDWHSRLENDWVTLALGQGLYNAFNIGFGERTFNPLDMFASVSIGKRSDSPGAPNPRMRMQGARLMGPLNGLSPFDIVRAFKDSGFSITQTAMNTLRGVSDRARMGSLGLRSMADVQQVLRYGTRTVDKNGDVRLLHRGVEIVLIDNGRRIAHIGYPR
jgi:hypothetical protein